MLYYDVIIDDVKNTCYTNFLHFIVKSMSLERAWLEEKKPKTVSRYDKYFSSYDKLKKFVASPRKSAFLYFVSKINPLDFFSSVFFKES